MLTSLAFIFLSGIIVSGIFSKLKLPRLLGLLIAGIILGPYALNLLDASILGISADLRTFALIIILIRAGLSLDINDLKKVGRPALLMCFVPACFELLGMVLIAPKMLGISILDAAIMGWCRDITFCACWCSRGFKICPFCRSCSYYCNLMRFAFPYDRCIVLPD